MHKRKETIALETLLLSLGLDLKTELEILDAQAPTAKDLYASLAAARTLTKAGIMVPNVTTTPACNIIIHQDIALKGAAGVELSIRAVFEESLHLSCCDVVVKGVVSRDNSRWHDVYGGLLFSNVEIGSLVTTTLLMASFVNDVFKLMFNSEYEEDLVEMVLLEGVDLKHDLPIYFKESYHDVLLKDFPSVDNQTGGYPDLVKVAALLFHRIHPDVNPITFVVEPKETADGHDILAVQIEEEA